jgi:hypothetical protein
MLKACRNFIKIYFYKISTYNNNHSIPRRDSYLNTYEELTPEARNAAKQLVTAWESNLISPHFQVVMSKEKGIESRLQTLVLHALGDHRITWDNLQELEDAELITISYPVRGPKTARLKRVLWMMVKEP